MSPTKADILLHPVRLRIVLALSSDRQMTTAQLADYLPDVAHATLYRHVAMLADAGLLETVAERRVRGGVERTYALASGAGYLGPEDVAAMSTDEQVRGFTVFAGLLIDGFSRYVSDGRAQPVADLVGYRQFPLWLDETEGRELVERLRSAIGPFLENDARPGRERVLLSTILFPDLGAPEPDPPDQG